ncbi:hypothetical protein PYW07_013255 [Mythimna separata]|uniref:EGF-like domain-containing protein n=1 Tax=Mythimna separata TaxID=271217 RepID=A0AAD8DK96_MYTSE|nr:hypothetical protein PYW07_013255 [Mythimna separata]
MMTFESRGLLSPLRTLAKLLRKTNKSRLLATYYYKSVGHCRSRRLRPRTVPGAVCSNMWRQSVLIALLASLASAWDIAVTAGDRIEFYNINDGTKTDTVHFPSQNLTTVAYDEVHDMLLYVDKQSGNDAICGYKMSFQEYQCYVERNGRNIQGLAFDPVTQLLFFTDTKERSINWFSFKPGVKNDVYGKLLVKIDKGIPTDIAVDSCRGYVYWINTNITPSTIERARFDGSDREVVIYAKYKLDLHSLAIDQQARKIYWKTPETSLNNTVDSADFDGKNRKPVLEQMNIAGDILPHDHPNSLALSNGYLLSVSRCSTCSPRLVLKYPKPLKTYVYRRQFKIHTESLLAIATNYKIGDQVRGIYDCSHILTDPNTNNDLYKIAKGYDCPFCVHGTKVIGQSICKCTPGYTGVRCEASVCDNYCLQGNCSFTEEGLPKCRCNTGYSGERCEVSVCNGYCLNDGTCSLKEDSEPFCLCKDHYLGSRCEISACESYCLQGNCTFNDEGLPVCRCEAGYTGERCEVNMCIGYCLNDGICSLNEEDEPVCECTGEYDGRRCEIVGSRVEDVQNKAISTTSTYQSVERSITLGELLRSWEKPIKFNVVLEIKSKD